MVPGAVAIDEILSVVHINYAIFFVGVVIAGKPNIHVSSSYDGRREIMMSIDATLTWRCVGLLNKCVLTKNVIG